MAEDEEIPQEYDLSLGSEEMTPTKKRERTTTVYLFGTRISQEVLISPANKRSRRTSMTPEPQMNFSDYRLFGIDQTSEMCPFSASPMNTDDIEDSKTHCSLNLCLGLPGSPNPNPKFSCSPRNRELTEDDARKIKEMSFFSDEEREEEDRTGISTQLSLSLKNQTNMAQESSQDSSFLTEGDARKIKNDPSKVEREGANRNSPWTIVKTLTASDIDKHCCKLILKKTDTESHIITHLSEELRTTIQKGNGVKVKVYDHNTNTEHDLVLWVNSSRSYVLDSGWVEQFVRRRNLKQGDKIGLFWNTVVSRLHFCVLSRAVADQKEP